MNRDEINLLDSIRYIYKYRRIVILCVFAGLLAGVIFSIASFMRGEMSKKYVIKSSIAVTSQTEDGLFTSQSYNPNSTDIHLAEDMVDSVIFVIKSDRTLEAAVDELQLVGISAKDIYDNLSLSQYNKTQIIDISLYWRNAEEGIRILEAINDVSPVILVDILKIGDVHVVNDPRAKYRVGGSVKASTWAQMTLLGFVVGIALAVMMMFVNPTLVNPDDIQNVLGIKLLGTIPLDKHYSNAGGSMLSEENALLSKEVNDSYLSAAYILQRSLDGGGHRIVFVTSAARLEGKTSAAANLGMNLASFEKKVLLIDMDLVAPNLGRKFRKNVDYEHTLNAVYNGDSTIQEAVTEVSGYLHVLPLIHDSREMVLNTAMFTLLKEKAAEYDYTIIDTSAIGETKAVLNLNQIADGAVLVACYDSSKIMKLERTKELLEKAECPIIGCIVNQVK